MKVMSRTQKGLFFSIVLICNIDLSVARTNEAVESTLRTPTCPEVLEWVEKIDLSQQYQPLNDVPSEKLPMAYGQKKFTELFGKPAIEWTRSELVQMNDHLLECGKSAGKIFRKKVRPFSRNLRNILIIQAQRKAKTNQ
jgi:hypothetical protein